MEQSIDQKVRDERMWGMFSHLSALAGYNILPGIGFVVGPLIIWVLKKKDSPFIDEQGKEALNFQISIMIYMFASAILILLLVGFLLLISIGIFQLIMIIIAAIKANNGEHFKYPLTIRFIK
jgi:uncharacterized Tic20 family protein